MTQSCSSSPKYSLASSRNSLADTWAFLYQQLLQGRCTVAWEKVCRPIDMGGLGIPSIRLQGIALRLRWEWLKRTNPSRAWIDLPSNPDRLVQAFFAASITCNVGNGDNTYFWTDKWLDGQSIGQIAPWVLDGVPERIRRSRTVRDALRGERWIDDIASYCCRTGYSRWTSGLRFRIR